MEHNELLIFASVIAIGIGCQWLAWRVKIPAILPLLGAGLVLGPGIGFLHPQESLGALYFPLVSSAVAIILFEGALTLTWSEIRTVRSTVRNLLTIGALVTWFGGALAARYIIGLNWELSLLFGALIIVTGPTVIAPLLRNVRPTHSIASVLKWEGIIIDPVGATIAVLIFEFIRAEATPQHTLFVFMQILLVGLLLGLGGGYITHLLISRYLIPDYLRDVAVLAFVLLIFAISNALAPEAGLLAVTVMGIYLANTDLKQLREIWFFKEKLSVLLISILFVLLAANVGRADLALLGWPSVLLLLVVLFVLRPIGIFLSTIGSSLTRNERIFLGWIAPRGIVAAAVSSLFVFELIEFSQYEEARILAPLTFLIIVGTVLLQGLTAKRFADWLGVREAEPQGFLIMGANEVGLALGNALQEEGFEVRLTDTNWGRMREGRMLGLDAYHGNLLSDFAEMGLDLGGIGRLLAVTRNDEANALACKHMEEEFGSSEVYQLPPYSTSTDKAPVGHQLGRLVGNAKATYIDLEKMMLAGATIKKTQLTEEFTYEKFSEQYADRFVPFMAFKDKNVIVGTDRVPLEPTAGWTLVYLLEPTADGSTNGIEYETTSTATM